ncbi:MAG: hypothetical protein ACKOQX_06835, partial [Actinomycetota bacterium]
MVVAGLSRAIAGGFAGGSDRPLPSAPRGKPAPPAPPRESGPAGNLGHPGKALEVVAVRGLG